MSRKHWLFFIIIFITALVGSTAGFFIYHDKNDYKRLNADELYNRIIQERDYGIKRAAARGDYRCCINPPCTMCYMEANKWNNFKAGTCACDDFIARGEKPCPQCARGVEQLHSGNNTFCDINATTSTCESNKNIN